MKSNFILPENQIYMCGHSLGLMPKQAAESIEHCLKDWAHNAVGAWNQADWIHLPYKVGALIAPLIGSNPDEVIVTDSTSVNLFKVLCNALRLNPKRQVIMTDQDNFPADLYIVQGIENFNSNVQIRYVPSSQILEQLSEDIAVLTLTHVNYRTSFIYDMETITKRAHELGIIVIWDLSHSVGSIPLYLNDYEVDFAVGCTYKYLNGGPGAPSFIYANKKYHKKIISPIYGWMGHKSPFSFSTSFEPSNGLSAYLGGTPSILSMKALEGALELFAQFSLEMLREKSLENSNLLINLLSKTTPELLCLSPKIPEIRGGHVAFGQNEAYSISRALIHEGVICDYREPNLLRLSLSPLYLDRTDIEKACLIIEKVIKNQLYEQAQFQQIFPVT